MAIMNDLYVLVDKQSKTIIDHAQSLPENWRNIHGLPAHNDEELSDLSWAGHETLGWICLNNPEILEYNYDSQWLEFSKSKIKKIIATQRWEKEVTLITIDNDRIQTDERTRLALFLKRELAKQFPNKNFAWKFVDTYRTITGEELIKIADYLEWYIQKCFDIEVELCTRINLANTLEELINVNLNLNWPSTQLNS
jgi:hypothetical protein